MGAEVEMFRFGGRRNSMERKFGGWLKSLPFFEAVAIVAVIWLVVSFFIK